MCFTGDPREICFTCILLLVVGLERVVPSVLWHCWLGGRKGIRPVKNWAVGCWCGLSVWSEVQTCIWSSWCHCHSLSLVSVKSRLVLPFWYRLTWVVPAVRRVCVCGLESWGKTYSVWRPWRADNSHANRRWADCETENNSEEKWGDGNSWRSY